MTYRAEDLFCLLKNGNFGPTELFHDSYPGGIVYGGRWMGSKKRRKPLPAMKKDKIISF